MSRGVTEQSYAPGRFGRLSITHYGWVYVSELQDMKVREDQVKSLTQYKAVYS